MNEKIDNNYQTLCPKIIIIYTTNESLETNIKISNKSQGGSMFKNFFFILVVFVLLFSIQSSSQILFIARLDGSQETPNPVLTTATGTAWAVLSPDMTTLTYHITYAQLDSTFTASHFHLAPAGVGGGVVQAITFTGNTASGQWTGFADSILAKLLKQEIYINIHSAKYPGGEIRGQLIPVDDAIGFTAILDGSQETPNPIVTNAKGTGWAVLRNDGSEIEYSVTVAGLSSSLTAAHFHNAAAGVGGGVVHPISFTDSTSTGSWTGFSENIISELIKNRLYLNVHSSNNPGGEIRGQLIQQGEIMFTARLEGNNETPNPIATDGKGTAWAVLSSDKSTLSYNITYAQLDSPFTAAHLHLAPAGVGGGVVHPITFIGNSASGQWTGFADSILAKLVKEHIYVNVHSQKYPGGEIRDQLHNTGGVGFTALLDGSQETPNPITTNAKGTGWVVLKDTAKSIEHNITIAGLSSNFTAAHFHNAPAGIGGGVVQPITFLDSSSNGTWTGFSQNIISELLKNRLYFNVHTTNNPGGEMRGQINFSNIVSGNVPVELISFSASIKENSITLSWTTATETNNRGFEIQRQNENNPWLTIGFIQGKGTSTEVQSYSFIDENLTPGKHSYRLKQIDFDGRFEYSNIVNVKIGLPLSFELSQNYPNPFNPTTTINFTLPEKTNVSLKIYNILGSQVTEILNEVKDAGSYSVNFNAQGLSSGIYIYKISTGSGKEISRKMTLLK
jgi:hypothetical protein